MSCYCEDLQTTITEIIAKIDQLRNLRARMASQELLDFCDREISRYLQKLECCQTRLRCSQMAQQCGFSDEEIRLFICP